MNSGNNEAMVRGSHESERKEASVLSAVLAGDMEHKASIRMNFPIGSEYLHRSRALASGYLKNQSDRERRLLPPVPAMPGAVMARSQHITASSLRCVALGLVGLAEAGASCKSWQQTRGGADPEEKKGVKNGRSDLRSKVWGRDAGHH